MLLTHGNGPQVGELPHPSGRVHERRDLVLDDADGHWHRSSEARVAGSARPGPAGQHRRSAPGG